MKKSVFLTFIAAVMTTAAYAQTGKLIDPEATAETKNLFYNLGQLSKDHVLFGHQHATEYGHGWHGEEDRSDVKSVTGSHPAVIGVDLMGFSGRPEEDVEREKERLRRNVIDTYNRGGVTTVAWHFPNPVSEGSFYWKEGVSLPAVKYIIPGGEAHEQYKAILEGIGTWAQTLIAADGKVVPLIFRPYHEMDGDWFWWGKRTAHGKSLLICGALQFPI